jgi:hypothetical protein
MASKAPDLNTLAARVDLLLDRLEKLDLQTAGLTESHRVEAKESVVQDERGAVRARFEMQEYSPRLTFFDSRGEERLRVGLHADGTPTIQVRGREVPLPEV